MGVIAKGGVTKLAPAGTHVAVCYRLVDIGTQNTGFVDDAGRPKAPHQVIVAWELSTELMDTGLPYTVSKFYTCSLHKKATLRAHLESWRGRAFTKEELEGFDLHAIVGVPCMLNVVHEENSAGDMVAKVASVMALPKGLTKPTQVNPSHIFDIDEWDQAGFDKLPDFMKRKVLESAEARQRNIPGASLVQQHTAIPDDEIPF